MRFRIVLVALALGACVPSGPPPKRDGGESDKTSAAKKTPRPTPKRAQPLAVGRDAGRVAPRRTATPPAPTAARVSPEKDPEITAPFSDNFDRPALGADWRPTRPVWQIKGGRLCASNARNHPVWLKRRIPVNARIEFDAMSRSTDGDIKAEFWGDGKGAATGVSYNNATSYITIFGGWKNQYHVLARIDEHAKNRPEIRIDPNGTDYRARKVEPNVTYHFKIVREDGRTVRWFVDDIEILSLEDPEPLAGPGHDHFGFNDWQVPVCFDNLVITPLAK